MFRENVFETVLSAAVAIFAIGFLLLLRWNTGIGSLSSYEINAVLGHADGLAAGTDVKIAGVKIGRITEVDLEPGTYRVKLTMEIRSDIKIPTDSKLSVSSAMMSSPYLTISPGHSNRTVSVGGGLVEKP